MDKESNSNEISHELNAVINLKSKYLQNQWDIVTSPEILINPTPIYSTPMPIFKPNNFIYLVCEADIKQHWSKIASETILGFKIS